MLQAQAWSILFIVIGAARARDEFTQSNPVTCLFVAPGRSVVLRGTVAVLPSAPSDPGSPASCYSPGDFAGTSETPPQPAPDFTGTCP